MKKNKGFTLIELMVTIAVLAIVAMMAAPSFGDLIAKRKLDAETRGLSFVLSQARVQATTLRANVTLKFQQGQNTPRLMYWVPESETILLDSTSNDVDFSDVIFTPIGQPKQRVKMIPNPDYNDAIPEDPDSNPHLKETRIPLKFTLCNPEIHQSRIISLSMNGTVTDIKSGQC
ncbi:Tfp pilus assembly protein FimT/FimU [Acinetobacter pseudolwoffii]|uniref:pilus assembly FimT family protein n=1 Tax=Acinetobacter pseudolwoffii TaxID=2053287 RepID=UPI0035233A9F